MHANIKKLVPLPSPPGPPLCASLAMEEWMGKKNKSLLV
jgi:hypothetical protein